MTSLTNSNKRNLASIFCAAWNLPIFAAPTDLTDNTPVYSASYSGSVTTLFFQERKRGGKWLPHNIRSNKRGKREEDSCKNSYQRDPIKLGSCLCGRQSLPRDRVAGSPSQQLAQLASPSSSSTREKFAAVMLMHTLLTIASISRSHPPYERTRHID